MKELNIIIPLYNEENTVENIVEEIFKAQEDIFYKENDICFKLILVDDKSTDKSLEKAISLSNKYNNIKVLSHIKNQGKGASLKTGFKEASGDWVIVQDADLEYSPYDYKNLLKCLMENNLDVCFGSRYLDKNQRKNLNFYHTLVNQFLTFLSNVFSNLKLTDMETCYKLFKIDVIKKIYPLLKENRFGFEPEITAYIAKYKYKITECPIKYSPRNYKEGKKINAKDGIRAIYSIIKYNIIKKHP